MKKQKIVAVIILTVLFIGMLTVEASAKQTLQEAFADFMKEYRIVLAGISGFGTLTSVLVFIWHFVNLATMPTHPIKRREAISSMVWSAVCTALLGSTTLILTLLYTSVFT